jgi:hypothetical protein
MEAEESKQQRMQLRHLGEIQAEFLLQVLDAVAQKVSSHKCFAVGA